jgi:hypothetical protein
MAKAAVRSRPARSGPLAPIRRRGHAPRKNHEAPGSSQARKDGGRGLDLLLIFLAVTLVMVADVMLAAAVDSYWVLIPVMCVHLAMTVAVFAEIMSLLADEQEG